MNSAVLYILLGGVSYLLGAIPFGWILSRIKGVDIRTVGSGNIGATNVFRSVSKGLGVLTFACDAAKGFIPAFVFPMAAEHYCSMPPDKGLSVVCAVMAIAGHNWPIYLRFKGGKGVATSAGALLGMAPAAVGVGLAVWIATFVVTRYVSVASITAAAAVAVAAWYVSAKTGYLLPVTLTLLAIVIIARHKDNIRRLAQGNENRFEFKKRKPKP